MEKIVERAMLYDFYGQLLTEHQRTIYEDVVMNDMSLSEVADEHGISRQGVHDLIKRCDSTLISYEEKLKLLERFLLIKEQMELLQDTAKNVTLSREALIEKIDNCTNIVLQEL